MKKHKVHAETDTHFIVSTDGKPPYKVLKAGLAPKLYETIRGFANGGVPGYDEGGSVNAPQNPTNTDYLATPVGFVAAQNLGYANPTPTQMQQASEGSLPDMSQGPAGSGGDPAQATASTPVQVVTPIAGTKSGTDMPGTPINTAATASPAGLVIPPDFGLAGTNNPLSSGSSDFNRFADYTAAANPIPYQLQRAQAPQPPVASSLADGGGAPMRPGSDLQSNNPSFAPPPTDYTDYAPGSPQGQPPAAAPGSPQGPAAPVPATPTAVAQAQQNFNAAVSQWQGNRNGANQQAMEDAQDALEAAQGAHQNTASAEANAEVARAQATGKLVTTVSNQTAALSQRLANGSVDPKSFWDGPIVRRDDGSIVYNTKDGKMEIDPKTGGPMMDGDHIKSQPLRDAANGRNIAQKIAIGIAMIAGGAPAIKGVVDTINRSIDAQKFDKNVGTTLVGQQAYLLGAIPLAEASVRDLSYTALMHQLETVANGTNDPLVKTRVLAAQQELLQHIATNQNSINKGAQETGVLVPGTDGGTAGANTAKSWSDSYSTYVTAARARGGGGIPMSLQEYKNYMTPKVQQKQEQPRGSDQSAAPSSAQNAVQIPREKNMSGSRNIAPEAARDLQTYPGSVYYDQTDAPPNDQYADNYAQIPGAAPGVSEVVSAGIKNDVRNKASAFSTVASAWRDVYNFAESEKGVTTGIIGAAKKAFARELGISGDFVSDAAAKTGALVAAATKYNEAATPSQTGAIEALTVPDLTKPGLTPEGAQVLLKDFKDRAYRTFHQEMYNKLRREFKIPDIDKVWNANASLEGDQENPASRPSSSSRTRANAAPTKPAKANKFGFIPDN